MNRSRIHMLNVAAARLEQEHGNPKLIADLRAAAKEAAKTNAECRYLEDQQQRIEHQRSAFANIYPNEAADRLKSAMLQRAYDLMWDGNPSGCDALVEFLPEKDVNVMFDAWQQDQTVDDAPKSKFYASAA